MPIVENSELTSLLKFDYLQFFEEMHYVFEITYDQNVCLAIMMSMIANNGTMVIDELDLPQTCTIEKLTN